MIDMKYQKDKTLFVSNEISEVSKNEDALPERQCGDSVRWSCRWLKEAC
jgi:hypothetical protein